jgi:uncharacterized protein (TIGR00290 family)
MEKAVFNWSGGKDSAFCLYKVLAEKKYRVESLLTTVSKDHQRISMHGVREELLEAQAQLIGIPVRKIGLTEMADLEEYEHQMEMAFVDFKKEGISNSIFGDIFLEDLKLFREKQLSRVGFTAVFPLWKYNTAQLARDFIKAGFKCIIVCVDEKHLDQSFAGRLYDEAFLNDLPDNVDPCGENGEFHTFVFDGPILRKAIDIEKGKVVYRKYPSQKESSFNTGFYYCDLHLKNN